MTAISILTSVRGTAQWLPDCLDSLLSQDVGIEWLVRANGADQWEETEEMLRGRLMPERHRIIWARRYSTLSDSLNDLSNLATSRRVMRLDPDDRLPPYVLGELLKKSDEIGPYSVVYGDYSQFGLSRQYVQSKLATPETLWHSSVGPYNFVVYTNFCRNVGWKEVGYEDWNMYIRLMAAGGIPVPIHRVILLNRVREHGRSAKFAEDHMARLWAMREDNSEWFSKKLAKSYV